MSTHLPAPPSRDVRHVSESHKLEHVRHYPADVDVNQLLESLAKQRVIGTLMIDLQQGGVGSVRLREERRLTFDDEK
jgi:hypothetical protein